MALEESTVDPLICNRYKHLTKKYTRAEKNVASGGQPALLFDRPPVALNKALTWH